MDLRFSQFEVLTTTGSFFVCLFFVCVFLEASRIEQELGASAAAAVGKENLFWTSVTPSGQGVVLSGAARDDTSRERAGQAAAGVDGVTGVDNRIVVIGEAGACQSKLDAFLAREQVGFARGKADIPEASYPLLKVLASVARNCSTRLEIASHTSAEGDATINLKLSQRRADAIRKHLVQIGVPAGHLVAQGYGETQPRADNATEEGRETNTRVEFRVIGDAA